MSPHCPCCGADAFFLESLPRQRIVESLQLLMQDNGIRDCEFGDYRLLQCLSCGLQFADPMAAPGSDFYTWVTRSADCYPVSRWEWFECRRQLDALRLHSAEQTFEVLDVGCGSGRFLRLLAGIPGCRAVGLDINLSGVEACQAGGLEAIHCDLARASFQLTQRFDVITLWHVVEHVADPLGLLLQAKGLLAHSGRIFFSVPLSPLSYEASWPDPLNLPPHHLTRWQASSIQALAKRVGMSLQLAIPSADALAVRVLRSLLLQSAPPFAGLNRAQKLARLATFVCLHPWQPLVDAYRQFRRPRMNGRVLPDVILVCLTKDRACREV
jgi:SAM-dependent methyltransferase